MKATQILAALSIPALTLVQACTQQGSATITFYGYPDNSPPGPATAHNCGGRNYIAGGTGTYADPLTMATAPGEYSVCEIVYIPYLEKYVRYEDDCEQCISDWDSSIRHVDIWTGSATVNGGNNQINCEDDLTPDADQVIIRDPAKTYTVDSVALYVKGASPACKTSHTYSGIDASQFCS